SCSRRNRRSCRPSLDTTRHWRNSTARPVHKAPTTRCSPTWRHTRRDQKPITPAATWTRKESQNTTTITPCEFRLEDPELHIPNKLNPKISNRPQSFGI